jgi:hypothetical protein
MPTKTWNLIQINVGGTNPLRLWWDEDAADPATTSASGWTVAKTGASNYLDLNQGLEATGFGATILPNTTAPTVDNSYAATAIYTPPTLLNSTDSISTLYEYNGVFPAGTWTFNFPVIAVTGGGEQDGRVGIRVFRGLRSGTAWASVTEISAARLVGTTVSNLTTTTPQTSTVTWSAPAFDLQNEFLIVKVAWEITGAGNNNNRDVLLRYGTGANITTPNFKKVRHIIT